MFLEYEGEGKVEKTLFLVGKVRIILAYLKKNRMQYLIYLHLMAPSLLANWMSPFDIKG